LVPYQLEIIQLSKIGYKFNFFVFFEELLDAVMWLTLPMGYKEGAKKQVCFIHNFLDFHLFFISTWFYMI
jgi:hypothetical protein